MRLKVLFIPTWSSGVTFYRMFNFWKAAHRLGLADLHVLWWMKNLTDPHPWQHDIFDPAQVYRITKEMQDWFVQSDITIIGTLSGTGVKIVSDTNASADYVANTLGIFYGLLDLRHEYGPNKVILTECDDNVISTPEYNPAYKFFEHESEIREITLKQFSCSDGLIVSTPYLKDIYSEFNDNINVVPNCIDFDMWDKLKKKKRGGLRIGWGGGGNHEEDLRILTEVIPPLVEKYGVQFILIHGCPNYLKKIEGVKHVKKWVMIDKWPQYLASHDFDIGIAPLVDNAFNRGKSNLKWLEYSALGIPTVASNVGNYKETINNYQDGFLVNDAAEWEERLSYLIANKDKRREMGRAARARVRKDFNVDVIVRNYVEILKNQKLKREIANLSFQKDADAKDSEVESVLN